MTVGREVVVLDANVLYPARLRDLFMRLAIAGLYQARWSDRILDECFTNLAANRPDICPRLRDRGGSSCQRRSRRMNTAHASRPSRAPRPKNGTTIDMAPSNRRAGFLSSVELWTRLPDGSGCG